MDLESNPYLPDVCPGSGSCCPGLGEVVQVKVAVSAISAANALQNLDSGVSPADWDFEKLVNRTRARWDQEPSRIEIEGSQADKGTFYTGMYHAFLAPNLFQDVITLPRVAARRQAGLRNGSPTE